MKRCAKCDNRKLEHCKGSVKSCQCRCTIYEDTIKNRVEPDHDPTHDEYYNNLNEEWRELQQPPVTNDG